MYGLNQIHRIVTISIKKREKTILLYNKIPNNEKNIAKKHLIHYETKGYKAKSFS